LNDFVGMFTEESAFAVDIADMRGRLARYRVLFEVSLRTRSVARHVCVTES
jgi:hypothetical protein